MEKLMPFSASGELDQSRQVCITVAVEYDRWVAANPGLEIVSRQTETAIICPGANCKMYFNYTLSVFYREFKVVP